MLAGERGRTPLMLLDDVMSELDAERRELLAGELSHGRAERDRDHRPRPRARRRRTRSVTRLRDLARRDPPGGARGVSRTAPRPLSQRARALHRRARAGDARSRACRRSGSDAAGPAIAAAAQPTAERDGVLTVTCEAAVWAQELDLMAEAVLARLNAALGAEDIRELRCRTG